MPDAVNRRRFEQAGLTDAGLRCTRVRDEAEPHLSARMSHPGEILIAGAGIGGLSAALALARAGFGVRVIEQAQALAEVGAGLQLSPNAMKALRALGVADALEAVASRPEALDLRLGKSGARVFSIPMGQAAIDRYGAPYLHVHRADLLEALRGAAVAAGAQLRLDARVAHYVAEGAQVRAGLDTGEVLTADILVAADGARSRLRDQMLDSPRGLAPPRFTGSVAWRALAPASAAPDLPRSAIVWVGPGRHAVTYRVRRDTLINFVGVVEQQARAEEGWNQSGDSAELAAYFAGWAEPLPAVIAAAPQAHRWALFDRDPLPRWTDGRVVLLGDACHPMPPFQAQGAAMAIEDAIVLARVLADDRAHPETALKRYEELRKPRTSRMLASARANMGVFHRSNFVTQLATYGPMRIADAILPGFVRGRQDWIYGHDVTRSF